MNILVAGNKNYGLAESIDNLLSNCTFASRTTGYDLCCQISRQRLIQESLNFDVFVSVSCLHRGAQTLLINDLIQEWYKNRHAGYIIVLGSTADTPVPGSQWLYPAEKKGLRAYCRQISIMISSDTPPPFKLTYLSPGNMNTPKAEKKRPGIPKLDTMYVAEVIKWLLEQPKNVNISELCLDQIQH